MAQDYKIKAVSATVKDWDSKFGAMKTYKLMLEGRELPVEMNKKADSPAPTVGQEIYGNITRSEYGDKFKSEQRQGGFSGGKSFTPRPDNSDGQRQGMCINNAANYINLQKGLSEEDWAAAVHAYASALYALGDLTKPVEENQEAETTDPSLEDAWDNLGGF